MIPPPSLSIPLVLAAALITGLFLGFTRAGYGIDYTGTSEATLAAVQDGDYDPWRSERNAPYPPYFYDLYRPIAGSPIGSAVSLLLNLMTIPVLMITLGASAWAVVLLLLTPQQVTNAFLNNPQFIALFGLALLAWVLRHQHPMPVALSGILLTLKPNQFLFVPLALLTLLPLRLLAIAAVIGLGFIALTFVRYGFWVPVWLEYGATTPLVSGDYDNLLLILGLSTPAVWGLRALIVVAFVGYLWRARGRPPLESLTVAVAASNLLGFHANIVSTLPLLALTFAQVPLKWSAALVGLEWAYALLAYALTGRPVYGFLGLIPVICLGLLLLGRVVPRAAGEEEHGNQRVQ